LIGKEKGDFTRSGLCAGGKTTKQKRKLLFELQGGMDANEPIAEKWMSKKEKKRLKVPQYLWKPAKGKDH